MSDDSNERVLSLTNSSDESDTEIQPQTANETLNTAEMTWPQYTWHGSIVAGRKLLAVCDYFGEKLAWFFGITTPRFSYVVEEYERVQLEEELERKTLQKLKEQAEEKRMQRLVLMEEQADDQAPDRRQTTV